MGIEKSLENEEEAPYLELPFRNILQYKIFQGMFQQWNITGQREQADLTEKYATRISDIIDDPENKHIRMLARTGDYDAAREMVLPLLDESNDEMKLAA